MSNDIAVDLARLETVASQLGSIIAEFDNATSLSEELEAAIGNPYGRSGLRDQARDFEERWDDKRGELNEGLKKIKEHVQGVIDGIREWDSETANSFTA